jgi:hypothetical protein
LDCRTEKVDGERLAQLPAMRAAGSTPVRHTVWSNGTDFIASAKKCQKCDKSDKSPY